MPSKDLDCLMFGTKCICFILGVYVIKLSLNIDRICIFNKRHIISQHYSDHPWNIMCSMRVGLSKHVYGKMPPKKAYDLVLGIFNKVHFMTICAQFEG